MNWPLSFLAPFVLLTWSKTIMIWSATSVGSLHQDFRMFPPTLLVEVGLPVEQVQILLKNADILNN